MRYEVSVKWLLIYGISVYMINYIGSMYWLYRLPEFVYNSCLQYDGKGSLMNYCCNMYKHEHSTTYRAFAFRVP